MCWNDQGFTTWLSGPSTVLLRYMSSKPQLPHPGFLLDSLLTLYMRQLHSPVNPEIPGAGTEPPLSINPLSINTP